MYRSAAAVPSLVTYCEWMATDLHVFDIYTSRLAVLIAAGCRSQKKWKPRLQPCY